MLTAGQFKRNIELEYVATSTTEVQFSVPYLRADSIVLFQLRTRGGAAATLPWVSTKDPSTNTIGFTAITGDTSTYDVIIMR